MQTLQSKIEHLEKMQQPLYAEFQEASQKNYAFVAPGNSISEVIAGFYQGVTLRYVWTDNRVSFNFEAYREAGGRYFFSGTVHLDNDGQPGQVNLSTAATINPHWREQHNITAAAKSAFEKNTDELLCAVLLFTSKHSDKIKKQKETGKEKDLLRQDMLGKKEKYKAVENQRNLLARALNYLYQAETAALKTGVSI